MSALTIAPASIRPDHVSAVIARLRRFTALLALCPNDPADADGVRFRRIGHMARPFVEGGAKHMIVVVDAPSFAPDVFVPRSRPRIDVHCYATRGHEAARLAYLVLGALCPSWQGQPFTEVNCRVIDVFPLFSNPLPLYDRDLHLDDRLLSFELDKSEIPVEVPA
jgi:hypothetical protein